MAAITTTMASSSFYLERCAVNIDNKEFLVSKVNSYEDLKRLSGGLSLDYRISLEDTSDMLSCFKGLSLNHERTSCQVFFIEDRIKVIGLATLFAIPFSNFPKIKFFQLKNDKLRSQSIAELLNIENSNTFIIEVGFINILPEYRHQKLAVAFCNEVLIPEIKLFIKSFCGDVYLLFSAKGLAKSTKLKSVQFLDLTESIQGVPISECCGKIDHEALFTSKAAEVFELERLPYIFNFSLGPVFLKKI